MKGMYTTLLLASALFAGLVSPAAAAAEVRKIHGADSSFREGPLGICWGMLRTRPGVDPQVVIRIRVLAADRNPFSSYSIQAVHPFSGAVQWIVEPNPLKEVNDVVSLRETFKNMGGRHLMFYEAAVENAAVQPDLVIYYLGIPDTTPEFQSVDQLEDYFQLAFERLKKMPSRKP